MRINTNMNAMTALNQMSKNTALAGASMGKISSGERINKAGDDAAGMAISEKMRSQIRGLDQASKNAQDGISVVQTAEGATEEIGNIAQRMRELSVQASNETNGASDRSKIQEELTQLYDEVDRIAQSTEFNGKNLLNEGERATVATAAVDTVMTANAGSTQIAVDTVTGFKDMDISSIKLNLSTDGTKYEVKIKDSDGNEIISTADVVPDADPTDGNTQADVLFDFGGGNTIKIDVSETAKDAIKNAVQTIDVTTPGKSAVAVGDLIDKSGLDMKLQIGANTGTGQSLEINISNISTAGLGLNKSDLRIDDASISAGTANANNLINKLDKALETINTSRANLGATQNRLESAQSNLTTSSENLTAAESRIRDVDVAKEMMNLSKLNLLTQASQAMAGQAKQQPEGVMQLLR